MKLRNPRRWFWLTLRLVPKAGKWFNMGVRVNTILLTRCPLRCVRCPMYIYGKPKKYEECTFEEWKTFFKRFPHRISLVYLSGGEPSLYKDIVPLTNWLIEEGYHVMVFTNFWEVENFQGIKPHWRLLFFPTFHSVDNKERYSKALEIMQKRYLVDSTEFERDTLGYSHVKPFFTEEWFKNTDDTFHICPDAPKSLKLFLGCVNLYRNDERKKISYDEERRGEEMLEQKRHIK